ncbi:RNA polymerase sigma factor [Prolixibacter denitrificans]|uniref:RNA polymerase sigma factor n=1 Tax=Prolixibacter denitrificans TaxID=1541063 RepID=UPI001FE821EC|nr:sigma-70 family RNA polymerase sigma factor [Prolixibacter denitrificans]
MSENARRDLELVKLAREGDEYAFARLMNRYKDAIYFMLLKMVNNRADAEDLTIEAFGKAFTNLHQYSPKFAFSTWLFRIASNNGIDFLRKRRANTVPLENPDTDRKDSEYNPNFKSETLSPEEKYIRQQRANILRRMVSRLKPRYRMLVELRYFKEYSYDEIAKELNLPLGTVKVQLFRAREMLFNLLNKTEMGSDKTGK